MILEYGITQITDSWRVAEQTPTGYLRIYHIYHGSVPYTDEETDTVLQAGTLCVLPSLKPYRMTYDPQAPLYCLYIHLDILPRFINRLVRFPMVDQPFLCPLFEALRAAVQQRNTPLVERLAEAFLVFLEQQDAFFAPDEKIAKAVAYLSAHWDQPVTVEDLSRMSCYNKEYFIRLFKKCTGQPPHRYLANLRFDRALRLLAEGCPVSQVAARVGYPDVKSFSRAFKEKYRVSPTQWRRNYRPAP